MKTKTEEKRLSILNAASEVFREMGFERASMSDIRARIGGSKATLYNYFPSKEKLFLEVMHQSKVLELEEIADSLNPDAKNYRQEMLKFGRKFLAMLYAPESIAIRHLTISESRNSDIGKVTFERAVLPVEKKVAQFLKMGMRRGILRTSDSKIAAIHLLSLLDSELLQRVLLGVVNTVKPEDLAGMVRRAVAVFFSGYGRHAGK